MQTSKTRLALFVLIAIAALPTLQSLVVDMSPIFTHWQTTQLTLILMYTTPAWAAAVLIFIQESYRAEVLQDRPITWPRCGFRLAGLGLLTTVIALAVNPVVQELTTRSVVYLGMISPALGFAGGALFWLLTSRKDNRVHK